MTQSYRYFRVTFNKRISDMNIVCWGKIDTRGRILESLGILLDGSLRYESASAENAVSLGIELEDPDNLESSNALGESRRCTPLEYEAVFNMFCENSSKIIGPYIPKKPVD